MTLYTDPIGGRGVGKGRPSGSGGQSEAPILFMTRGRADTAYLTGGGRVRTGDESLVNGPIYCKDIGRKSGGGGGTLYVCHMWLTIQSIQRVHFPFIVV